MAELSQQLGIKHLRLVQAITQYGNLSNASKQLNLTQSALSHQLKNLEEVCNQPLFHRSRQKMIPTAAGERVINSSKLILAELALLESDLHRFASGAEGSIKLSSECYTSFHWLPKAIEKFETRFPKVQIKIDAPVSSNIFDRLADGQIDLAITMYKGPEEFHSFPLFQDELVVLAHPNNVLAKEKKISIPQLLNETLIVYPHGKDKLFKLLFGSTGGFPVNVVEMPLTEGILEWCSAGLGVAITASWAATRYINNQELVSIPIDSCGTKRTWHGLTLKQDMPVYLSDFIEMITQNTPGY